MRTIDVTAIIGLIAMVFGMMAIDSSIVFGTIAILIGGLMALPLIIRENRR